MKSKHITVKENGVHVKIYAWRGRRKTIHLKDGTPKEVVFDQFDVVDYVDGRRKFITFGDEKRARAKALEIARRKAPAEFGVVKLDGDEPMQYESAKATLRGTEDRLDKVAVEYADARKRLGNVSVSEAVTFYLRMNPQPLPDVTVKRAVTEMVKAKRADGVSAVYLKDLEFRLGKFVEKFNVPVASLTVADLTMFLRDLDCGPRSRNNYRLAVTTFIKFCEASGYIHEGAVNTKKVSRAKEAHSEIEIFGPREIAKLIIAAKPAAKNGVNRRYAEGQGLLPLLLLGAFAGLRTAEIERQRWEDVMLDRGFIRVTGVKGNTAQKRLVPISENLKAWLLTCRKASGLVCDIERTPDAIRRMAERAGVAWKHNALRHSFISYRCAETQDVAKTSFEAGNSPTMIHKHYRELVTPEQAKEWFSITPGNVFAKSVEEAA